MATKLLYYDDSYLRRFEATVIAHGEIGDRPAVVLDRSGFYPEGGGQPADFGMLNGRRIVDVQLVDGISWHVPEVPEDVAALPLGAWVSGEIDWQRRFDHMQQHCGQHILTAAFIATCNLPTTSFHLSAGSVTIDLAAQGLSVEQVQAAEDLANAVIWENRPISARIVPPDELVTLPLRKPPSVTEDVRVVTISDFDYSACGGTHPAQTGAVGQIRVLGWSRQRGGVRVEFACGARALAAARKLGMAAESAAALLSISSGELPAAVERLQYSQKAQAKELEQARTALDQLEGERRYAATEPQGAARVVIAELAGYGPERLRTVAQAVAAQPGGVAALGSVLDGRAHLVVACAADSGYDARAILQAGLPLVNGRGGGNGRLAQGGGPATEALDEALAAMGR